MAGGLVPEFLASCSLKYLQFFIVKDIKIMLLNLINFIYQLRIRHSEIFYNCSLKKKFKELFLRSPVDNHKIDQCGLLVHQEFLTHFQEEQPFLP